MARVSGPTLVFGTPRKLPRPDEVAGRAVVVDIAFAGGAGDRGFDEVTLPFIRQLGGRLRAWVDHHDHCQHAAFAGDARFVLGSKARFPSCPEMITPALVERVGPIDSIVCHVDFDGLASAAKWILGGREPYPGWDRDARAIDTRLGRPGPLGDRIDRALRARPRDRSLFGVVVELLVMGAEDEVLWREIDRAAAELLPIEQETRRASERFVRLPPGVALVDVSSGFGRVDKTLLLLLGQEQEPVSVVVDRDTVSVAARFDSGHNFVELLQLPGGMPTRVSVPRSRVVEVLGLLGVPQRLAAEFG